MKHVLSASVWVMALYALTWSLGFENTWRVFVLVASMCVIDKTIDFVVERC